MNFMNPTIYVLLISLMLFVAWVTFESRALKYKIPNYALVMSLYLVVHALETSFYFVYRFLGTITHDSWMAAEGFMWFKLTFFVLLVIEASMSFKTVKDYFAKNETV